MPKNALIGVPLIPEADNNMTASIDPVNLSIQYLDNISIQVNSDYDSVGPQGALILSGSNDHKEYFGVVENEGNFVEIDRITYNGSHYGSELMDMPVPSGLAYLRVQYHSTYVNVLNVTAVANTSNLLRSKYFLIDNAPSVVNDVFVSYYVWFKSAGSGVDPALPGRTGIEVDISNNDTADAVATAIQDAINGTAADNLSAVATLADVAITMAHGAQQGGGSIDAGTSGLVVSLDSTDGHISVYASGKSV
jgi:hypothetical protein